MEERNNEQILVPYFWQCFAMLLLGIIIGFIFSPTKNGISIGNNNHISGKDEDDEVCGIDCDDATEEI